MQTPFSLPFANAAVITNDGVTIGVLILILTGIFVTSSNPKFKKFYKYVPALLLCYFLPGLLNSLGVIDGHGSNLYFVASRFLLPASLVLLCLSVDLKGILRLGPKALIMFFTATISIIIGAPIALWIMGQVNPDLLVDGPTGLWRGLSTIAGSWIGGGANQSAMAEISQTDLKSELPIYALVDVFVANIWMAFLLIGAGKKLLIDRFLKADTSAIDELKDKMEAYQSSVTRTTTFNDLFVIAAIGFTGVALGHLAADFISPRISLGLGACKAMGAWACSDTWSSVQFVSSLGSGFFWLIIVATSVGVALSFSKLRKYEGAGASKIGSVFLYLLVATIGMHIDFREMINDWDKVQWIFYIGLVWMLVHIIILLAVAYFIKAPFFFVAVGSQANIGGAASAPIVASAFAPALAPVGVLLAVLGYVIGTIGAIICMELMHGLMV